MRQVAVQVADTTVYSLRNMEELGFKNLIQQLIQQKLPGTEKALHNEKEKLTGEYAGDFVNWYEGVKQLEKKIGTKILDEKYDRIYKEARSVVKGRELSRHISYVTHCPEAALRHPDSKAKKLERQAILQGIRDRADYIRYHGSDEDLMYRASAYKNIKELLEAVKFAHNAPVYGLSKKEVVDCVKEALLSIPKKTFLDTFTGKMLRGMRHPVDCVNVKDVRATVKELKKLGVTIDLDKADVEKVFRQGVLAIEAESDAGDAQRIYKDIQAIAKEFGFDFPAELKLGVERLKIFGLLELFDQPAKFYAKHLNHFDGQ